MSQLSSPAKASNTRVARWTKHLATVLARLKDWRIACCRSLITTLAADPGMVLSSAIQGGNLYKMESIATIVRLMEDCFGFLGLVPRPCCIERFVGVRMHP